MFGLLKKIENKTIHLSDDSWENEILNYKGIALIDIWATWCGPCKILGPIIDEISNEIEDSVKICKLNTEENNKSHELGIRSIPTLLIYQNGEQVDSMVGLIPKNDIINKIKAHL